MYSKSSLSIAMAATMLLFPAMASAGKTGRVPVSVASGKQGRVTSPRLNASGTISVFVRLKHAGGLLDNANAQAKILLLGPGAEQQRPTKQATLVVNRTEKLKVVTHLITASQAAANRHWNVIILNTDTVNPRTLTGSVEIYYPSRRPPKSYTLSAIPKAPTDLAPGNTQSKTFRLPSNTPSTATGTLRITMGWRSPGYPGMTVKLVTPRGRTAKILPIVRTSRSFTYKVRAGDHHRQRSLNQWRVELTNASSISVRGKAPSRTTIQGVTVQPVWTPDQQ